MKFLSKIITIISVLFLLWSTVSYIEILCKHGQSNPQYSSINLWTIAIEEVQK